VGDPARPPVLIPPRALFEQPAPAVAPLLLNALLTHRTRDGAVTVRLTEVEAYQGQGEDPGSHAHRGQTRRNSVMFGQPGHLYTYFTYGMHTCANVVCLPESLAGGVLLRAGELVDGVALARSRRTSARSDAELARGPARLAVALGITLDDGGADLLDPDGPFTLRLAEHPPAAVQGPRVGVAGPGGDADRYPWRFWVDGEPTVSTYRPAVPRRRRAGS
jgi:DNA-3-methyladenine glycosylase